MSPPPAVDALSAFRATVYATVLGQRKDSLCDLIDAGRMQYAPTAVPETTGSWILPLDVARRAPPPATKEATAQEATAQEATRKDTPTAVVLRQLRAVLSRYPAAALRPVVALDSTYDPVALARAQREPAGLAVDVVVRVAAHRVFSGDPGPSAGKGRPRVHGAVLRSFAARTRRPTRRVGAYCIRPVLHTPYGTVVVRARTDLHVRQTPDAPFTVVQSPRGHPGRPVPPSRAPPVASAPRRERPPAPLWLAWLGGPLPDDLLLVWRWYQRRFTVFTVEQGFRFGKATLGWTTVRPRAPAAADRWTWRLVLVFWQPPRGRPARPAPARRRPVAVGSAPRAGSVVAGARAPRLRRTFGVVGHSRPVAPAARKVARTPSRRVARPCHPLLGRPPHPQTPQTAPGAPWAIA